MWEWMDKVRKCYTAKVRLFIWMSDLQWVFLVFIKVCLLKQRPVSPLPIFLCSFLPGDIHKAKVWLDEEGLRAECVVWLRDRSDHLQPREQAVPVCQHWHGQGPAQIHRVQRASREPDQCRHYRGKRIKAALVYESQTCLIFRSSKNV